MEQFGDDYRAYMKKVPGMNFFSGLLKKRLQTAPAMNPYIKDLEDILDTRGQIICLKQFWRIPGK